MKKKLLITGIVVWVLAAIGLSTGDQPQDRAATTPASPSAALVNETPAEIEAPEGDPTEEAGPSAPEVVTKTETKQSTIPFKTTYRDDGSLAKGTTRVVQAGVNGLKEETYEVTYTDGVETGRRLVSTRTTKAAVDQIIANGTYVAPAAPQPTTPCANGTYVNSAGNTVCRPSTQNTGGATAICRDGTYSYSQSRRGTCSYHGGVSRWL